MAAAKKKAAGGAWRGRVCLLAALAFCAASVFMLIERRERLQASEAARAAARDAGLALQDERRSLQLDYETLTRYDTVAAAAARLGMYRPQAGGGGFMYLPEPSSAAAAGDAAAEGGQ